MHVLNDKLISVMADEQEERKSLPEVLAALMSDRIREFAALRAHQRHAWHAFLVQLAAMSMHRANITEPPDDATTWHTILLALTPGESAATAWSLTAPADRPAFLQPPIPQGIEALSKTIETPDALDMLVTSRNHDLKQTNMAKAMPEDWLFALLTLQTMEGFLGAGNYGISRMNGGFASRPALSITPRRGPAAHFRRDVQRVLKLRDHIVELGQTARSGGIGLVWLIPWDGNDALKPEALDPFYIEICRRIRLVDTSNGLLARAGSSKCARIQPTPGGVTGDPWAPLKLDKDDKKVLTLDAAGFTYRRVVDLIFGQNGFEPAPLQEIAETDAADGLMLVARGLVRGQGKTEGYHERMVPLSRRLRGLRARATDPVAEIALKRVQMAGEVQRRVLKPALLALFQNGPDKIDFNQDSSSRKAEPFLAAFDRAVDIGFFEALWREVEAEDDQTRHITRTDWLLELLSIAEKLLRRANGAAPKSSHRQFRAFCNALDVLGATPWRNEMLRSWMPEKRGQDTHHAA